MTYMYMLQGLRDTRALYIGRRADLRQRVTAHRDGRSRTTRRYQPMRLIYYEAFQVGGAYRNLLRRIRRSRLVVLTHGGAG